MRKTGEVVEILVTLAERMAAAEEMVSCRWNDSRMQG